MAQLASYPPQPAARPRRLSPAALARLGVNVLNKYGLVLQCRYCGIEWSARPDAGAELPPGYWRCPNRCNW